MHTVSKYENIKPQQQETWIVLTAGTPPSWYWLNFACMPTVKTSTASFKSQQYPRHYRRLYFSDRWHIITYLRQYHGDGINKYVDIKAHKRWLGRRGVGRVSMRRRDRVVCASDPQSSGPSRFVSRSSQLLDLFSVVSSSNPRPSLLIANWLPSVSWSFYPCYVIFELFVSNYWSGVPVN